jgi:hypothetical protein
VAAAVPASGFAQVNAVIQQRCTLCPQRDGDQQEHPACTRPS